VNDAREVWLRLEAVHAVTYFAPQSVQAAKDAGLKGFWMGYFGFRAAPLGAVSAAVVDAVFYNFAPRKVHRALPDAWGFAPPDRLVGVRATAAATALRAVSADADAVAGRTVDTLAAAVAAGTPGGRPIFAANRDLPPPADPVERLWQYATALREHRGDGHVSTLTTSGVDGLEAHVLIGAERGVPPPLLQQSRGWTDEEWDAACERLRGRGLLAADGTLTADGVALRRRIEAETDRLAAPPYDALGDGAARRLAADLAPLADAVAASGLIPYPNPIGLRQQGT
jgi:hypothetical protein